MVEYEDLVLYNSDPLPKFLSENKITPEIKEDIKKTLMKEFSGVLYNLRR
nr:MAG: hypothetical protein [uncultured archaeon]